MINNAKIYDHYLHKNRNIKPYTHTQKNKAERIDWINRFSKFGCWQLFWWFRHLFCFVHGNYIKYVCVFITTNERTNEKNNNNKNNKKINQIKLNRRMQNVNEKLLVWKNNNNRKFREKKIPKHIFFSVCFCRHRVFFFQTKYDGTGKENDRIK